jgi:phage gp36-like protein
MAGFHYTSPANVKRALRKLPSSVTDEDIYYHIQQADALIDAKLGAVMSVPLSLVSPLVEKVSTDLTIYFLAENLFSSNMPNLDETYTKRYDRAIEWLENMVEKEMDKKGSDFASTNDEQIFTYDEPKW